MSLNVVILAAGQGTRMHSKLPKVLHKLAGKPLLQWVIDAANSVNPQQVMVIYGYQGEQVKQVIASDDIIWVHQAEQLGTGHAVQQALPHLNDNDHILVLVGDAPLINPKTLQNLIEATKENEVGIVTAFFDDPCGLGRILRDNKNNIVGIVEQKDATDEQQAIEEVNTGIMLLPAEPLKRWLSVLNNNNQQQEFYLTDVIAMAVTENIPIRSVQPLFNEEVIGVNNRCQLAQLENTYQALIAEELMLQGITLRDPARFDVRGNLDVGEEVSFDINVIVEGNVKIGDDCNIGANVCLKNVTLGNKVTILANCILEDSIVGDNCIVGPFARLRPGTELANNVKIGNFVETKKTIVGEGSKIPHLSYIGDAEIGKNVNIGAGVITCNYDGVNKHKTIIGDGAFIGTDSQLIAPVTIGKGAYIGAGSSISRNAPADKLTVARGRQKTLDNWQPPKKE